MKRPVTMPALSDTMNNGRLVRWLRLPGDAVKSGDAIAEVETDKAVMEVEAFHDGYLAGPLAPAQAELPVGDVIGFIADTAAEASEADAREKAPSVATAPPAAADVAAPARPAPASPGPVPSVAVAAAGSGHADENLSPRMRALSRHAAASGNRREPVAALPEEPAPPRAPPAVAVPVPEHGGAAHAALRDAMVEEGPPYTITRAPSLREAVAHNVAGVAATPTFRVTARLSLDPLKALASAKELSLTVLLARACAAAIGRHPLFNAAFTPQGLAHRARIDIGIAVDGLDSLFSPVLRDVGGRTAAELAGDWRVLLGKVRAKRLALSDYRGATFYLSNLGTFDVVHAFDSIVPAGAAAILAVAASGADGANVTLSCDHRVVFGADAARFLTTLRDVLASPASLL